MGGYPNFRLSFRGLQGGHIIGAGAEEIGAEEIGADENDADERLLLETFEFVGSLSFEKEAGRARGWEWFVEYDAAEQTRSFIVYANSCIYNLHSLHLTTLTRRYI